MKKYLFTQEDRERLVKLDQRHDTLVDEVNAHHADVEDYMRAQLEISEIRLKHLKQQTRLYYACLVIYVIVLAATIYRIKQNRK